VVTWEHWCRYNIPRPDTISVRIKVGTNGGGPVLSAVRAVWPCMLQSQTKRVQITTDHSAGSSVLATSLVLCPVDPVIPVGSVIAGAGRVVASAQIQDNGLPGVVAHQELDCG
jgi:hypothetical protein